MSLSILTVSQLNFYVKTMLDSDSRLRSVYLKGEISNLTDHQRSGHIYFTLKDAKSALKAVMFANSAKYLKFRPENGMTVIVKGRISLYEAAGTYQLYADDMQPDGTGAINLAFEQLKKKLSEEGLFDESRKKPLPSYPKKIGVITSPEGAALQDISKILKRRYPIGTIVLCPVQVQGEGAARQMTEAVRKLNRLKCADVIIIGRGGGSAEDLQNFNDESLARAIAASDIPVVSAVGHETDFTICDLAADVRASTPSAGAELVSPEIDVMRAETEYYCQKIHSLTEAKLNSERRRLDTLAKSGVLRSPFEYVNTKKMMLDLLSRSLMLSYTAILSAEKQKFAEINAKLDALSPLKVLYRGYSVVMNQGKVIHSIKSANVNDNVDVMMSDGVLKCSVTERVENNEKETGL